MKKVCMFICMLFFLGGILYISKVYSSDTNSSTSAQNSTAGQKFGPPPEAYAACKDKKAGVSASFINPRGETVTGTCEQEGNQLVLRPTNNQGLSGGGHHGPPPEAYTACEGKSSGSTSQFVNPRGETVTGICQEENGKMVLRPDFKN